MANIKLLEHLLPKGNATKLTTDRPLTRYIRGLANGVPADFKKFASDIWFDLFPSSTRVLEKWETQFGLFVGVSIDDRIANVDAAWKSGGAQGPQHIEDTLQAAGFDVYVHPALASSFGGQVWDLSVYTAQGQATIPLPAPGSSMAYKPDGSGLAIGVPGVAGDLFVYNSKSWDPETVAIPTELGETKDDTGAGATLSGITFSDDGAWLYAISTAGSAFQSTVDPPFQTFNGQTTPDGSVALAGGTPQGIWAGPGGTLFFYTVGTEIRGLIALTPYDITTAIPSGKIFDLAPTSLDPRGLDVSSDGKYLLIADGTGQKADLYTMAIAFDLATIAFKESVDVSSIGDTLDVAINRDLVPLNWALNTGLTPWTTLLTAADPNRGFTGGDPFSVGIWASCGDTIGSESDLFYAAGRVSDNKLGTELTQNVASKSYSFFLRAQGTIFIIVNTVDNFPGFHHVVFTWDGTTAEGVKIYVDGVAVAVVITRDDAFDHGLPSWDATADFLNGGRAANSRSFAGVMASPFLTRRVLNPTEIAAIFAAGVVPTYDPASFDMLILLDTADIDNATSLPNLAAPDYPAAIVGNGFYTSSHAGSPLPIQEGSFISVLGGAANNVTIARLGLPPATYHNPNAFLNSPATGVIHSGAALAHCGEVGAVCAGLLQGVQDYIVNKDLTPTPQPPIPSDPDTFPFWVYVGGETFPDRVVIDSTRKQEFESLLISLCPGNYWIGLLIDYTGEGALVLDENGFIEVDGGGFIEVI